MPYCTSCGAKAAEGQRYCERCGEPIEVPVIPVPPLEPSPSPEGEQGDLRTKEPSGERASHTPSDFAGERSAPEQPVHLPSPSAVPAPCRKKRPVVIVLALVILLALLIGAAVFVVLPKLGAGPSAPPEDSGAPPAPATVLPTPELTAVPPQPTPTADPYAAIALPLRTMFSYNTGEKYASRAAVYRYWINGTYQWHNDNDNRYYTQRPRAGNKYLFVYVVVVNDGTAAYPYPKSRSVSVHYDGKVYSPDTNHYLPGKGGNPVEIREVQQQHDYFNAEYVEDYGYSHGTMSDFISPGQSNAIDGYITYEVPESLAPEKTYVEIVFDSEASAVWRLG